MVIACPFFYEKTTSTPVPPFRVNVHKMSPEANKETHVSPLAELIQPAKSCDSIGSFILDFFQEDHVKLILTKK